MAKAGSVSTLPSRGIMWRMRAHFAAHAWMRWCVLWAVIFLPLAGSVCQKLLENKNYIEIFPSNLLFPVLLHAFTAAWVSLIIYKVRRPRRMSGKIVAAALLGLLLLSYSDRVSNAATAIKAVLPVLPGGNGDMAMVSIVFMTLIIGLACAVGVGIEKIVNSPQRAIESDNVVLGVFIVAAVAFVAPASAIMPLLPDMFTQSAAVAPELPQPKQGIAKTDKPDVYYIVLDRYTSNQQLKQQFNFDNADFTQFLQKEQFTVNQNAFSHYPFTAASIASTMSGQYTGPITNAFSQNHINSRAAYHSITRHSPVVKAFKEAGYSYHTVGSWYGASNEAPLADTQHYTNVEVNLFGLKKRLHEIEETTFMQTPYYNFTNLGIPGWPLGLVTHSTADGVRDQLRALDNIASQKPGGRFIFAHLLVPHSPYIFNADGTIRPDSGSQETMAVKAKYINQVQFINSQMQQLITRIKERSNGKAAIILNADEGEYPMYMESTFKNPVSGGDVESGDTLKGDMAKWSDDWLALKYGILQAVYLPGASYEELQKVSSVNVLRIALNQYAGYDLPYLPACHFAFPQGWSRHFTQFEVSNRLIGRQDPACQQFTGK